MHMKILYLGISSKYIHTLPAGWFLAEYLKKNRIEVTEVYHNINEDFDAVLQEVLDFQPDILLLSVYIFNVPFVKKLAEDIRRLRPGCKIIVGGPEADESFPADHTITGEGEEALRRLLVNGGEKNIDEERIDLAEIPSPYTAERLQNSHGKLIYYESSRGCPFSCAYCMAGLTKSVRYFPLERVYEDLINIVNSGAKIIKFTDRTFNADAIRAEKIIAFIAENFSSKGVCFHFEVGGDLFRRSTLDLLKGLPNGLVQIEAGVQSLNEKSLAAVNRPFNKELFIRNMAEIIYGGNIHVHLDLIAGLPHETLDTFAQAINQVLVLRPHMLQLGFLKFLKGTPIRKNFPAKYCAEAPYEVISTPDMSEDELQRLRTVAAVIDKVYNSGRFHYTLEYLFRKFDTPFSLFSVLADFFLQRNNEKNIHKLLLEFLSGTEEAKQLLRFDFLVSNNSRKVPRILQRPYSDEFKTLLAQNKPSREYMLGEFVNNGKPIAVRFDYTKKHPVTGRFAFEIIS